MYHVYLNGSEDQVLFPFDCRIKQAFDRSEECFLLHSLQNTMDTVAMFRCVFTYQKNVLGCDLQEKQFRTFTYTEIELF